MRFHVLSLPHTISNNDYIACAYTQKVVKFCRMMKSKNIKTMKEISNDNRDTKEINIKWTEDIKGEINIGDYKVDDVKVNVKDCINVKVKDDEDKKDNINADKNQETKNKLENSKTNYIYHYGHEESKVDCDEHITVMTNKILQDCYKNYDHKKQYFKHNMSDEASVTFTRNTIMEMKKHTKPRDFILCFWGRGHESIIKSGYFNHCIIVEPGIGYPDTFAPFRVFESYAWMHHVYGRTKSDVGKCYDCVIPNYFDPSEFNYNPLISSKRDNYYLYLGRHIKNKGMQVLVDIIKNTRINLLMAGQGDFWSSVEISESTRKILKEHITFIGHADLEKRRELLFNARALIAPTLYIEPFGGVVIEAALSGTPVITTDWGSFTEIVVHGKTGYRCRNMDQFSWAIRNVDRISPRDCRRWAIENFSLERIKRMYEEYFQMLYRVFIGRGFDYVGVDGDSRSELDWLEKIFPCYNCSSDISNDFKNYNISLLDDNKDSDGGSNRNNNRDDRDDKDRSK